MLPVWQARREALQHISGITHMKIVFTAEHAGDQQLFSNWANCRGKAGRPAREAERRPAIELAHDAEVLVTSYDEGDGSGDRRLPAFTGDRLYARQSGEHRYQSRPGARYPRALYAGRNADAAAELTLGLMLILPAAYSASHAALKRGEFTHAENAAQATQSGCAEMWWGRQSAKPV